MHQSGGHRAYSSPGPVAASTPSGPVAALPGSVASPAMKAAPPTYAIQGGRFPSGPRGIANGPGGVPNGGGPTPVCGSIGGNPAGGVHLGGPGGC
ncbi:hypothetical protein Pst134EA_003238 [Puccinia striiformis f. sp. tritici]|uniref:hypothetical protein n=1 Tax=Puccinia striiformis f. sp. tritici TaxID=168172 RepID=UPI0020089354|nr:hypothetical protein Pst134EA_003238 [Puccinia striiformis f. sp. tritici]KAH9464783.1 hypothetical protein Pst134EB_004294 [Puccinia striiformis f. sp. tritici]KAH9472631.1 hypothetical protein Pst134EA_003238 [Puccinia striiformis f. sp. tritici]KAI9611419.1 hypothetical protein H4Q26_008369 [Puccinia striiformis f. sp. tritici PST-130]